MLDVIPDRMLIQADSLNEGDGRIGDLNLNKKSSHYLSDSLAVREVPVLYYRVCRQIEIVNHRNALNR